jgi:hypothetical protein
MVRHGLVRPRFVLASSSLRPRFVLAVHRDSRRLRSHVRLLDQPLFGSASGSTTGTIPALRWRRAVPVAHQARVRCQV